MILSLIVAVDEANGIGFQNHLLCHLPADLQRFKQITLQKPVIMGRRTFESIGRPLPQRQNIVITHHPDLNPEITCTTSLSAALTLVKDQAEVMVIGGAQIYQQALPLAQRIYLTRIHHRFKADVFFPVLNPNEWRTEESYHLSANEKNRHDMTFYTLSRVA